MVVLLSAAGGVYWPVVTHRCPSFTPLPPQAAAPIGLTTPRAVPCLAFRYLPTHPSFPFGCVNGAPGLSVMRLFGFQKEMVCVAFAQMMGTRTVGCPSAHRRCFRPLACPQHASVKLGKFGGCSMWENSNPGPGGEGVLYKGGSGTASHSPPKRFEHSHQQCGFHFWRGGGGGLFAPAASLPRWRQIPRERWQASHPISGGGGWVWL